MVKRKLIAALFLFTLIFIRVSAEGVLAETLEERLNNFTGPERQYNTMLSPVYLRNNVTEESVSPQSGELSLAQTDYVLPGRNGLDLEIKRLYKSGISNVKEMKVKYVNGAWVDYVYSDAQTSSFYEDRYDLGIGMRFSFPAIEIIRNSDGTSHKFLHTDMGDVYTLRGPLNIDGTYTYSIENQTVKDVVVREDGGFSNGQADGVSKYLMVGNDGKKTYFSSDGCVLGIVDRYGNTIKFEYIKNTYTVDGITKTKKLISTITDTVGRVTTFEYKQDYAYKVGAIDNTAYGAEESWKQSQNPDLVNSGDLKGKFQVIVRLPGGGSIVYDKTAVLVGQNKNVIRTRLQRVFDIDGKPKYHYWYEQTDLGFTYANHSDYSVYNRYENLVQIDFCKTNLVKRYTYSTGVKGLADDGSMQYRKIFEKAGLSQRGFDPAKSVFTDRFICDTLNRTGYTYTNEADGYGFAGYKEDDAYLRDTYRYSSQITDMAGSTTSYAYNGFHELISTEETGKDHKEITVTEHDEMRLPKKNEKTIYNVVNGQPQGEPVKLIENFRHDEYGNLTNYTGPIANRDANGYPTDTEHTVIYAYAYDKYHVPTLKTWKQDAGTTCQVIYDVDARGNITGEKRVNSSDQSKWVITDYKYDSYGNVTEKTLNSADGKYSTFYEYGTDADGNDQKGAYLTKEYSVAGGREISQKHTYDFDRGVVTADIDAKGGRTGYTYDTLERLVKETYPDATSKEYTYYDSIDKNKQIEYTDQAGFRFLNEYDAADNQVKYSVYLDNAWHMLNEYQYDFRGNKTQEKDANGHSIRISYNSKGRPTAKTNYKDDSAKKEEATLSYAYGPDSGAFTLVTMTDEDGYVKKLHYDAEDRLVKAESSPDNAAFHSTYYTYDYTGNTTGVTDARGNTSEYAYDPLGRLEAYTDALSNRTEYAYDSYGNNVEVREPGGRTTHYVYDELQRLSEEKVWGLSSEDYTYKRYSYDDNGNVTVRREGRVEGGTDKPSAETGCNYDSMNRVTDEYAKVDGTAAAHKAYTYNGMGLKTSQTEYANAAEDQYVLYTYGYDFAGKQLKEEGIFVDQEKENGHYLKKYTRDLAGNILKQEEKNGSIFEATTFEYDHMNRLVKKVQPYKDAASVRTTAYAYDKRGNMTAETLTLQGSARTTSYSYDGLGKVEKKTDPLENITRYLYDENGNLVKEIGARYQAQPAASAPGTEYEYDRLDRLVKTTAFDGAAREVLSYVEYDARGNVVREADGEGYNDAKPAASIGRSYVYDADNRVTAFVSAQNQKDQLPASASYKYDGSGRVVSETDALGNATASEYYMNGGLKKKTYADGSSERYSYDLTGKLAVSQVNREGLTTKTYNNLFGKPVRTEYPDNTAETFEYDEKGELIKAVDKAGNAKFYYYDPSGNRTGTMEYIGSSADYGYYRYVRSAFDEADRLLSTETFEKYLPLREGLPEKTLSAGDRVEYSYDKAGNALLIAGPGGREVRQDYDADGNPVARRLKVSDNYFDVVRYEYDSRSRVTAEIKLAEASDIENSLLSGVVFDKEYKSRIQSRTEYTYYSTGKVKTVKDGNGNSTLYKYDLDGRPTEKAEPLGKTARYRYDAAGNLIEDVNAMGVSADYDYDEMNRLVRKKEPAAGEGLAVTRYIYDAMDRVVKQIMPNDYRAELDTRALAASMPGTSYVYDSMGRKITTISPYGEALEYLRYDANGNIARAVDGLRYNGSIDASPGTAYEYDGLNRAIKVTDALGFSTEYEYGILGGITRQTDARGNSTGFEYNGDGTLKKVSYPDGGEEGFGCDGLGRRAMHIDQRGNTSAYAYNAFGSLRNEKDPYGNTVEYRYDLKGNAVSIKDKRGGLTGITYDALNRMAEKRTPIGAGSGANTGFHIEKYTYDLAGNLLTRTVTGTMDRFDTRETVYAYYSDNSPQTMSDSGGAYSKWYYDRNGNAVKLERLRENAAYDTEKYEYDRMDRLVKAIRLLKEEDVFNASSLSNINGLRDEEYPDMLAVPTVYEYDLLGNRTKEVLSGASGYLPGDGSRGNYTIEYTYDTLNRPETVARKYDGGVATVQYGYDEVGNRVKIRSERGFDTLYAYDAMNRPESITDPLGNRSAYAYDLAGNKIRETNAKGDSFTYTYDRMNRQEKVIDPEGVTVAFNSYDESGNLVAVKDAKSNTTKYEYDLGNRPVRVIDPEAASRNGFTEEYKYNQYGEKISAADGEGNTTAFKYDKGGRLAAVTDPLGVTVQYGYDNAGNRLYTSDGENRATSYAYTAFGMLKSVTDADGGTTFYSYDLAGNVAGMLDRNGSYTVYTYDGRNLLTDKIAAGTGDSVGYVYDAKGNRTGMTDESGSYTYGYDENDRLTEIKKDGKPQIAYAYDETGHVSSVTDGSGEVTSYAYDKSGRMETAGNNGETTRYAYDLNGNREAVAYPGGVREEYAYDKANRLVTLVNKKPDGAEISRYSYTYDKAGRQISKTDSYGTSTYAYDKAGRVLKVTAPGKTTVYGYDGSGNRVSMKETYTSAQASGYVDGESGIEIEYIVKGSRYVYSKAGKLLKQVEEMAVSTGSIVLTRDTEYLYDGNGNQLAEKTSYIRPTGGSLRKTIRAGAYGDQQPGNPDRLIERTNNTYDGFNRLKKAEKLEDGIRTLVEYTYDGDDLRVGKTVRRSDGAYAPETTLFLYDRGNVILETDGTGNVKTQYTRGINYIASHSGGSTSLFLYNGHGDVVQMVTAAGEVRNNYDYDIFGNPTLTVEYATCSIRYAGEYFDKETGLYYLRARYYDPHIGRFITEDTYRGKDQDPLSLNLYTYCHNDPINFVDPTGHVVSNADKQNLSASDQAKIQKATDAYNAAKAKGDKAGMDKAHADAEAVRSNSGYSGGVDGSENKPSSSSSSSKTSSSKGSSGSSSSSSSKNTSNGKSNDKVTMFWEGYTETVDLDEVDYYKQRGYSVVTSENLEDVVGVIKQLGTTTNSKDKSSKQEFAGRLLDGLISSFITTNEYSDKYAIIPDQPVPGAVASPGDGGGTINLKNQADYNLNKIDSVEVALRINYGVGNDNDFADGLYAMLPSSVQAKVDIWVKNNKNLATTNPDLYNTKYADEVLNFYDATKENADMLNAMDSAIKDGDPFTFIAAGIVYGGVNGTKTKLKAADLPTKGKIRYIPPKNWSPSEPLPRTENGGYLDRFGNEWVRGPSRTQGQPFEWDVQLSNTGKSQLGWASRDGAHVNVSLDGKITH